MKLFRFAALGLCAALLACATLLVVPSLHAQQTIGAYTGPPAPMTIGPLYNQLTGSYAKTLTSGTIGAGATANSPIYSFRYTGTGYAVIKRVVLSAGNAGTGFASGVASFGLYAARSFSASDSGGTAGTLTGNNGKLRTSFATMAVGDIRISSTAALTAGTRTLDTDPLGGIVVGVPTTANAALVNGSLLDPKNAGDYPLVLAVNEGFVIQATVPATGTWSANVYVEWDEYITY